MGIGGRLERRYCVIFVVGRDGRLVRFLIGGRDRKGFVMLADVDEEHGGRGWRSSLLEKKENRIGAALQPTV